MGNMLDDGAAWLVDKLDDHASHAITYSRAGNTQAGLRGTRAVQQVTIYDASGIPVVVRQVSFVIRAATLTMTPQRGDIITEAIGVGAVIWEVAPQANGTVWQYESAGHEMLRVFVVEVA